MGKKPKKKQSAKFKKSLTQATHPIPPKRVEPDEKKYDRKKEKKKIRKQLKELDE